MLPDSRVQELEAGYKAVFEQVQENGSAIQGMKSRKVVWFQRRRLNDCLARLDRYAEHLERLDRDLGEAARVDGDFERRLADMPRYAALMNLGTAVYNALYKDYRELRKLREVATLCLLALIAGSAAVAAILLVSF